MTRTLPQAPSMTLAASPSLWTDAESTVNGHTAYDSPPNSIHLRRAASDANGPCPPPRLPPLQPLSLHPGNQGSRTLSAGPSPTRPTDPGAWTPNDHQEEENAPGSPEDWDEIPSRGPQRPMRATSRSGHSAKKSAKLLGISPLDALHQFAAGAHSPSTPSSASSRSTVQVSLPDFPCQREDLTRHRMLHDSAQKQSSSPRSLSFSLSRRKPFRPRDFVLTSLFKPAKPTSLSESSAFSSLSASRAHSMLGSDLEMDLGHIRDPMIPAVCVHSFKLDETQEWERLILTPGSYVTVVDPAIATGGKKTDDAWFLRLSGITMKRAAKGGKNGLTPEVDETNDRANRLDEGRHAEWLVQLRSMDELRVWQLTIQTLIRTLAKAEQRFRQGGDASLAPYDSSPYMPKRTPNRAPHLMSPTRHQPFSPTFRTKFGETGRARGSIGQDNRPSDGQLSISDDYMSLRASFHADAEQMRPTKPSRPSTQGSLHPASSGTTASSLHPMVRPRSSSLCRERSCELSGYTQDVPKEAYAEDSLACPPRPRILQLDTFEDEQQSHDRVEAHRRDSLHGLLSEVMGRSLSSVQPNIADQVEVGISEGESSLESLRLAPRGVRQASLLRTGYSPDVSWTDSPSIASDPSHQPFSYDFSQRRPSATAHMAFTQRPENLSVPSSWAMSTSSSSPGSARSRSSSQASSPFSLASVRASMATLPPVLPPPSGALPPPPSRRPSKGRQSLAPSLNVSCPPIRRTGSSDGRSKQLPPTVLVPPGNGAQERPVFTSPVWAAGTTSTTSAQSVALSASPSPLGSNDNAFERHSEQADASTIFSSIPLPAPPALRSRTGSDSPEAPSTPSDGTLTVYSPNTPATSTWGSVARTSSRRSTASRTGPRCSWEESAGAKKRVSFATEVSFDDDGRRISTRQIPASLQPAMMAPSREGDPCVSPTTLSRKAGHASFRAYRSAMQVSPSREFNAGSYDRMPASLIPGVTGQPGEGHRHQLQHSVKMSLSASTSSSGNSSMASDMSKSFSSSSNSSSTVGYTAPLNIKTRRQPLWGQGMPVAYTTLAGRSSLEGLGIDVDTLLESGLLSAQGEHDDRSGDGKVQSVRVSLHGVRKSLQVDVKGLQQQMCDETSSEDACSFDLAFPSPPPRLHSSHV